MSISEEIAYDKEGEVVKFPLLRKLFLSLVIILVSTLSFALGKLSAVGDRGALKIEYDPSLVESANKVFETSVLPAPGAVAGVNTQAIAEKSLTPTSLTVVASKNGKRYHFLHCSGTKQIKEENKIVFGSPAEAEMAGYTLALNCKPR